MNNEGNLLEQHIDPRCSVIRKDDSLIIDLDHSPDAGIYILFLKLMAGMFILPLILFLTTYIFDASIVLIVCLIVYSPFIIGYFYQKSRKFIIEINRNKHYIRYQRTSPNSKIFKSFSIDEIDSLLSRRDIEIMIPNPNPTFSLKFKLRNKRKKKIHTGDKEDVEKLGNLISEFLEIPYTKL